MLAAEPTPFAYDYWSFNPGVLEQDLYTIPLEAALLLSINKFNTPASSPLVLFKQEVFPDKREQSRHTKHLLVPGFAVWTLGTFLYANSQSSSFSIGAHTRGLIHSVMATELTTSFAKVTFRRPRPVVEGEKKRGGSIREDDYYSFFSGHASHAFNLASYTTGLVHSYVPCTICSVFFGTTAYTAAAFVASARAIDGQHNWSDVAVGSLVGLATGLLMQQRVTEVSEKSKTRDTTHSTRQRNRSHSSPDTPTAKRSFVTIVPEVYHTNSYRIFGFSVKLKLD